jgi:hypothetical protein
MKKTLKVWGAIALFALFACMSVACSGKSGGGKSINGVDELKAYLDKQPADSIDKPIKVAMKANEMMLGDIVPVLNASRKYVSLDLSGSPLKTIPDYAFVDINRKEACTALVGIIIPKDVTSIGQMAFGSSSLTNVKIPNGVTSIGEEAFLSCKSLTSVIIGKNVTSIEPRAFENCASLTSVTFQGKIPLNGFNGMNAFPDDLRDKFYAKDKNNGTPGTYITSNPGRDSIWTRK